MICSKCNKDFPEEFLQLSHDIPKYMGGTDKDGRHWLCKNCHEDYDNAILVKILIFLNEEEFNPDERILWMKELSMQPENFKRIFRKIARECKEEFF